MGWVISEQIYTYKGGIMISVSLTILGIAAIILVAGSIVTLIYQKSTPKLWTVTMATLLALVFVWRSSVPAQEVITISDYEIAHVFDELESKRIWKWDKRLNGAMSMISYRPRTIDVDMQGPQAVTENPKVREITYTVTFTLAGTPESALDFYLRWGYSPAIGETPGAYMQSVTQLAHRKYMQYVLFEFNERMSKEIAAFYNPLDGLQQERFRRLVEEFVNDELASTGIHVGGAEFRIPIL